MRRELTKEMLEDTKKHFADKGYELQWFAMAQHVLLFTLGKDWWNKNCAFLTNDADAFLNFDENSLHDRYINQHRVIRLGHMLYALKEVDGYDNFLSSLVRRDLEATYFELTVANMLFEDGYKIRFIAESGKKTEDYDLLATIEDIEFCIEAKSRRDGAILGTKTLRNTLEKARKQLPKNKPGVIFVSIPIQWTSQPNAEDIIGGCIANFLNSTKRINFIILSWNALIDIENGEKKEKAAILLYREYRNSSVRHLLPIEQINKPITENYEFQPSFW